MCGKVLIVDDSSTSGGQVRRHVGLLFPKGWESTLVQTVTAAVSRLRTEAYDAVLLDLKLDEQWKSEEPATKRALAAVAEPLKQADLNSLGVGNKEQAAQLFAGFHVLFALNAATAGRPDDIPPLTLLYTANDSIQRGMLPFLFGDEDTAGRPFRVLPKLASPGNGEGTECDRFREALKALERDRLLTLSTRGYALAGAARLMKEAAEGKGREWDAAMQRLQEFQVASGVSLSRLLPVTMRRIAEVGCRAECEEARRLLGTVNYPTVLHKALSAVGGEYHWVLHATRSKKTKADCNGFKAWLHRAIPVDSATRMLESLGAHGIGGSVGEDDQAELFHPLLRRGACAYCPSDYYDHANRWQMQWRSAQGLHERVYDAVLKAVPAAGVNIAGFKCPDEPRAGAPAQIYVDIDLVAEVAAEYVSSEVAKRAFPVGCECGNRRIWVRTVPLASDSLAVDIIDDGCGFNPADVMGRNNSFQDRARKLAGWCELEVYSKVKKPPAGTVTGVTAWSAHLQVTDWPDRADGKSTCANGVDWDHVGTVLRFLFHYHSRVR